MSDDDGRKAHSAKRELKETEEAFHKLRQSFVERIFATKPDNVQEREQLYMAVKVLDRVRGILDQAVQGASDTDLIEEAAKAFRAANG